MRPHNEKFALSDRLKRAIRDAGVSLTVVGFPYGFSASRLSQLLCGAPFGPTSRPRVVELAESLGITADDALVRR